MFYIYIYMYFIVKMTIVHLLVEVHVWKKEAMVAE